MPDFRTTPLSRRALLTGFSLAGIGAAMSLQTRRSIAQEDLPVAVGTPPSGSGVIRSTGNGPVPSTGASRPGPANVVQNQTRTAGMDPVGLAIERAGIDAGIESLRVVDGAMQDPSGPWEVAWYENLGNLVAGNIVMAGHIDYWNVGPSVFYNLASLQPGDEILVSGDDGKRYPYTVEWIRQYDSATIPLDEVAGPTGEQSLTLITCGGAFDYVNGHYLQRTVVRANRSGPGVATTA